MSSNLLILWLLQKKRHQTKTNYFTNLKYLILKVLPNTYSLALAFIGLAKETNLYKFQNEQQHQQTLRTCRGLRLGLRL